MKKLLIGLGVVLLAVIITASGLMMWMTSEGFIRKHILGKMSEEMGKPIVVKSIDVSLFKKIEIKELRIGEEDDPRAHIPLLRVRYSLMDMALNNTLRIKEATLHDAQFTLRTDEVDTMEKPPDEPTKPKKPQKNGKGLKSVFVENVDVNNLSLQIISEQDGVTRQLTVSKASFKLPLLKNGDDFEGTFGAEIEAIEDGQTQFAGRTGATIQGHLGEQLRTMRIDSLAATVDHQDEELVALRVTEPISVSEAGLEGSDGEKVPISFAVSNFDIEDWLALVPESAGLEAATGVINVDSKMTVDASSNQLTSESTMRADNVSFQMTDGTALKTVSLTLDTDMTTDQDGTANIQTMTLNLQHADETLLDVQGRGSLAPSAEKSEQKSTLRLETQQPVDVERLLALYTAGEKGTEESAETQDTEAEAPGAMPWMEITVVVPEATYKKIALTDANFLAEMRGTKITIKPSNVTVAGGTIDFDGSLDTADEAPTYQANARVADLPIGPFMQTFVPASPVTLAGGLQSVSLTADGKGFAKQQILDSLNAALDFDIDQLEVEQMEGMASTLVNALLLSQFGIGRDQLNFADGEGKLSFANGMLDIKNLDLSGASLGLNAQGNMEFADGVDPDLRINFRFPEKIGQKLVDRGLNLDQQDSGTYTAAPLELSGQFWKRENLAKLALKYGAKIGRVDSRVGDAAETLDALKNLQSKDGETADPEATLEGALKLIQGARNKKDQDTDSKTNQDDEETEEKSDKDKAKDAVKDILGM
ncbi:MAG: AsmA family protein [Verrucomicrobiota bacterium]